MSWYKLQETKSDKQKNPVTLVDVTYEGLLVFCWCNRCGHNKLVDPVSLTNLLGPFFPVPKIGGRMRCSLCQARDIATRPAWPDYGGGQIARHT